MNILKWKGLDVDPMKIHESVTTKAEISQVDTSFNESTNESGITVLYPKIEAIHAGRTRNFNRYLAEKLKGDPDLRSGVYSWTAPYPKPVIHNHDVNTEPTGRVYSASYSEFTAAGRPGIIVTPKITQEKAIKDILEGRLLTVSIGASTNAAVCSVCGTDIINEGWCGHMRGEEYDGQVCEWVAGDLFFDELSWVNVPADSDAMITNNGSNPGMMSTGEHVHSKDCNHEHTDLGGNTIVTGSVTAKHIADSTTLTAEPVVVTSSNESTEKEERIVEQEDQVVATEPVEEAPVVEEKDEATSEAPTAEEPVVAEEEAPSAETKEEEEQSVEVAQAEEPAVVAEEEKPADAVEDVQEPQVDVQEQLDKAKEDLKEANDTIEELKEANVRLAKELQEATVNFLVDLRMATGKEENREAAVEKFAARSLESLRDSISDILADKPSIKTNARTVEHVERPAGQAIVNESKTLATAEQRVTTNEDALISLLTGRR